MLEGLTNIFQCIDRDAFRIAFTRLRSGNYQKIFRRSSLYQDCVSSKQDPRKNVLYYPIAAGAKSQQTDGEHHYWFAKEIRNTTSLVLMVVTALDKTSY